MKQSLILKEKRSALVAQAETLMKKASEEKRSMSDDEKKDFKGLDAQIIALDEEIELVEKQEERAAKEAAVVHGKQTNQQKRDNEVRSYSFLKAINEFQKGGVLSGYEKEMHEEALREAKEAGISISGLGVPNMVLRGSEQRALDVATEGTDLIQTDKSSIISALRQSLQVTNLGATMMTGLQGNIDMRRQNAVASAAWESENSDNNETTPGFDKFTLSPKRLGAYTDISKQVLIQVSPDMEAFVRNDLMMAIRIALDLAAINGSGSSNQPTGILNTSGIGAVAGGTNGLAPTFDHLVDLESAIAVANADLGKLAYLTTPGVRGKLKKTKIDSGSGQFVWANGSRELNGYRAEVSTQVPSTLTKGTSSGVCHAIIFGNWADLLIGQWAGLDIVVDGYTQALAAKTRLVVNSWWDINTRHPESFAAMKDALIS